MIFVWCTHDLYMIYIWSTYDPKMIYIWSKNDLCMIYTWSIHDLFLINISSFSSGPELWSGCTVCASAGPQNSLLRTAPTQRSGWRYNGEDNCMCLWEPSIGCALVPWILTQLSTTVECCDGIRWRAMPSTGPRSYARGPSGVGSNVLLQCHWKFIMGRMAWPFVPCENLGILSSKNWISHAHSWAGRVGKRSYFFVWLMLPRLFSGTCFLLLNSNWGAELENVLTAASFFYIFELGLDELRVGRSTFLRCFHGKMPLDQRQPQNLEHASGKITYFFWRTLRGGALGNKKSNWKLSPARTRCVCDKKIQVDRAVWWANWHDPQNIRSAMGRSLEVLWF